MKTFTKASVLGILSLGLLTVPVTSQATTFATGDFFSGVQSFTGQVQGNSIVLTLPTWDHTLYDNGFGLSVLNYVELFAGGAVFSVGSVTNSGPAADYDVTSHLVFYNADPVGGFAPNTGTLVDVVAAADIGATQNYPGLTGTQPFPQQTIIGDILLFPVNPADLLGFITTGGGSFQYSFLANISNTSAPPGLQMDLSNTFNGDFYVHYNYDYGVEDPPPPPIPGEVPEPTSLLLVGTGLVTAAKSVRNRIKK